MDILLKDHNQFIKQENPNPSDSGCETSTTKSSEEILTTSTSTETIETRNNPEARNKKPINKIEYAKLHRSLSPTRSVQLQVLKSKYEKSDNESDNAKSEKDKPIRQKSKLPLPIPRNQVKSEVISPSQKVSEKIKNRHSLMLDKKSKKDENSNEVFRKNSSSSGEFITIIPRSESVETVDQFEKELNLFTMDKKPKEKKRTNSFRKIFSGKIFNKEKKKKDETEKRSFQTDNLQNENQFSRQSSQRNGTNVPKPVPQQRRLPPPNIDMKEIEKRYAQMHVKEFNSIKQNFENQNNIDETDDIPTLTPGPMDFNKVPNINKFIDTSSSASIESEKDNYKNFSEQEYLHNSLRFTDNRRDTPPRAQELRQDVRLVNPKALIPINSERPLPNPYQNVEKPIVSPKPQFYSPKPKMEENKNTSNIENKPTLDETYGTVFDNIDKRGIFTKVIQKPPKSPSLEPSKLRLPSNRDTGPMSPRMKSPIPQHHVSTEKLIATELLRTSRSPTPTKRKVTQSNSVQQKQESNPDYSALPSKPPYLSRNSDKTQRKNPTYQNQSIIDNQSTINRVSVQSNAQLFPTQFTYYENGNQSPRMPDNYDFHYQSSPVPRKPESIKSDQISPRGIPNYHSSPLLSSQERLTINSGGVRSPTPTNPLYSADLSLRLQTSRPSTPVDSRIQGTKTPSPQKEEMRRSVEAYYWKEIKKLKEQENRDLYYYQTQMLPFGYSEDPISYRRSRSSSPSLVRNSRRSLSLPREPKQQLKTVDNNDNYGRYQPTPIPEGRAVINYANQAYHQQHFRRNAPERRTIDSVPKTNTNSLYRPIFKRGSLTNPIRETVEDQQQKKVSFNRGPEKEVWPTKNGFTQSPPQRRIESARHESMDDDVFVPNQQQTSRLIVDGKEIYGYTNRPFEHVKYQDPNYQNANLYKQIQQEPIYNRQEESRIPKGMIRYNSMQLVDPTYIQNQRVSRRMSFDNAQSYVSKPQYNMPRRQVILNDDIYGYFGGYLPNDQQPVVYSSRQNIAEPSYGYNKQVTVRDKVCDMYGQIHDRDSPSLNVRKSGVMLGQLQPPQNAYPHPQNQNFVRNSRLTASANDMYRRYQNVDPRRGYETYQTDRPPSRPLPPIPKDKNIYYRQNVPDITQVLGNKNRGNFGKMESTTKVHNPIGQNNMERIILLEQLQLLKRQQELEHNKWKWQKNPTNSTSKNQHQHETHEYLSLSDLKKVVLLEELKLLRLKLKIEIDDK